MMSDITSSSTSFDNSTPDSCWKYDVFLSFRGKDTRKTFVDHLYTALEQRLTCTYKDDETLERGDTIGPSLLKAIEESQIAVIIFSKNYAASSWCLDELACIMKCRHERRQIVIPIFYDVEPSEVRNLKGEFGKAFAKVEQENTTKDKVESWRKALIDASNIAGWEPKHIANGHEAKCIKDIVVTILDKLSSLNTEVDVNLVGMRTRLHDIKVQLEIGSGGVRMVGIWGVGGGGKTTLASSIFTDISSEFDSCCFVDNIREESSKHNLKYLQEKILSDILKTKVKVSSVGIGKNMIKDRLSRRNVLIVLDDVDNRNQLEALASSRDWFGNGSRIIVTTRDKHLLSQMDVVSPVSLLSKDEAIRLFNKHAYNEENTIQDYKMFSERVVSYAGGLPLALKVLGSFLYDKDNNEWVSTLDRLKDNPNMEIVEILKISYDGLEPLDKELFLDIACFCTRWGTNSAMVMLDACGFHPIIGVKVLIQKGLISVLYSMFDMHDLVEEMAHYIVRGECPNNPEKHSRVWRQKEIEDMCSKSPITENDKIEAIQYFGSSLHFPELVSHMKKLRSLDVHCNTIEGFKDGPTFLSNELRYIYWNKYPANPFPDSFHPSKLVVLKIDNSLQEELWKGNKVLPCLKELELSFMDCLVRTPDFSGLPCLQKLTFKYFKILEEIHPSLGNHTSLVYIYLYSCDKLITFPTIIHMERLKILDVYKCRELREFPKIEAHMDSLINLHLENVGIEVLPSSVGEYCTNLISVKLNDFANLKSIEGNFHALKHLQNFKLTGQTQLEKLPKDLFCEKCCLEELRVSMYNWKNIEQLIPPHLPRFLTYLNISGFRLKNGEIPSDIGELSNLQELHLCHNDFSRLDFSLSQLTRLKLLDMSDCCELVELPELPSTISILKADGCKSLEVLGDFYRYCKWLCHVSLVSETKVIGGGKLLQTMLQGMAIGNHCAMSLQLKDYELARGFRPRLRVGSICRLQLPENWYNHFSGFLICAVHMFKSLNITMKDGSAGIDLQHDVFWEEANMNVNVRYSTAKYKKTWLVYVPFSSLRHTLWLDENVTCKTIEFFVNPHGLPILKRSSINGFGVTLIPKKNQIETTIANSFSESSNEYECKVKIEHDSKSALGIHTFMLFKW